MAKGIVTYEQFWLHYLREHARPGTRALHFLGTAAGLLLVAGSVALGAWWLLPAGVGAGYLFAWIGHLAVERNRPATFGHPLWSLASDFRMFFLWSAGRLEPELRRAGVAPRRPTERDT
jgi:hypothetical protein